MNPSRKRSWSIVVIYIVIIYINLYLLPSITKALEDMDMLSGLTFFIFIAFLVLLWASCRFWFKIRKSRAYQLLLVITLAYLIALHDMADPVSRIHLIEYTVLIWLLLSALRFDLTGLKLYGLAITILFLVGTLDEVIQIYIPTRVFDINDIFENSLGGYLGAAIYRVFQKYRTNG